MTQNRRLHFDRLASFTIMILFLSTGSLAPFGSDTVRRTQRFAASRSPPVIVTPIQPKPPSNKVPRTTTKPNRPLDTRSRPSRPLHTPTRREAFEWGLPNGLRARLPVPGYTDVTKIPISKVPYDLNRFRAWLKKDEVTSGAKVLDVVTRGLTAFQGKVARGNHGADLKTLRSNPRIAQVLDVSLDGLPPRDVEGLLRLRVNIYEWCAEYGREYESFSRLVAGMRDWYSTATARREAFDFAARFHMEASYNLALRYYSLLTERFSNERSTEVFLAKKRMGVIRSILER